MVLGFPLVRFLPLLNNFLFVCHKFVSEPFIRPPTLHRIAGMDGEAIFFTGRGGAGRGKEKNLGVGGGRGTTPSPKCGAGRGRGQNLRGWEGPGRGT